MAKITNGFSMTVIERRYHQFSESIKREKVKEIEEKRSTIPGQDKYRQLPQIQKITFFIFYCIYQG